MRKAIKLEKEVKKKNSFCDKLFKDLTNEEKDELLKQIALRLQLVKAPEAEK